MSPEPEPYREDDEDDYAPQSIFAAGWFRAALVLTVLAIVVVVSLPYLLNWFEPAPVPPQQGRGESAPSAVTPQPAPSSPPAVAAVPAETKPPSAAVGDKAVPEPKAAEPKPAAGKPGGDASPGRPVAAASPAPADKPLRTAEAKPTAEQPARAAEAKARPALPKPAAESKPAPAAGKGEYWVQLGVFKERPNAEAVAKVAREQGYAVEVTQVTKSGDGVPAGSYHLVRAGSFPDLAAASKARDALRGKGHTGFVTKSKAP